MSKDNGQAVYATEATDGYTMHPPTEPAFLMLDIRTRKRINLSGSGDYNPYQIIALEAANSACESDGAETTVSCEYEGSLISATYSIKPIQEGR